MKKAVKILEFFLISVFLVIPPLFVKQAVSEEVSVGFSLFTAITLLVSMIIYFQYEYNSANQRLNALQILLKSAQVLIYFGILIFIHTGLTISSILLKIEPEVSQNLKFTPGFLGIISVAVNFIIRAFYEECIYRMYIPFIFNNSVGKLSEIINFKEKHNLKKIIDLILKFSAESAAVLIFALSHAYLGIIPVVNAVLGGIVLRICFIKNKSVLPGTISHFIYNCFVFIAATV